MMGIDGILKKEEGNKEKSKEKSSDTLKDKKAL
jgi:hypothetical protein